MGSLELTHSKNLLLQVADRMGYGRQETLWSTLQVARLNQWVNAGYRLVLFPEPLQPGGARHHWSFLWPDASLTLSAPYSTGTIRVTSGTVKTFTGALGAGTFVIGELVTQAVSLATGYYIRTDATLGLVVLVVSGTFNAANIITGVTGSWTTTAVASASDESLVTGTATTFPTWAAEGELTPTSGDTYPVKTYLGATGLLLDDAAVTVAALTTYSLGRCEYDLPAAFGGLQGPLVYRPESSTVYRPIEFTNWQIIKRCRQLYRGSTMRPTQVCLLPKSHDGTASQGWKLIFDYQSDAAYVLNYRYKVNVEDLNVTHIYAVGGPGMSELLKAASCYAAMLDVGDDPNQTAMARQDYLTRLSAAIAEDGDMVPDQMTWGDDRPRYFNRHDNAGVVVTYSGVQYY